VVALNAWLERLQALTREQLVASFPSAFPASTVAENEAWNTEAASSPADGGVVMVSPYRRTGRAVTLPKAAGGRDSAYSLAPEFAEHVENGATIIDNGSSAGSESDAELRFQQGGLKAAAGRRSRTTRSLGGERTCPL